MSGTSKPQRDAAALPDSVPSLRQSRNDHLPLHAPAETFAWVVSPGTKQCRSMFQVFLPPACECRCTAGLQPPDMANRSHSTRIELSTT